MNDRFHKLIARLRSALERPVAPSAHEESTTVKLPEGTAARRAELISQFAHELERVNGHFIGALTPTGAWERVVALTHELGVRSVAVGEGVTHDPAALIRGLQRAGIDVLRTGSGNGDEGLGMRERLARCDLAVAEAHYAIAATGSVAMVAIPARPGSLTLLPPVNVIVVDAARVLPNMASVVSALGPDTIRQHRVAFITGPSRTADIEKMIVLGVHGPKHLYAGVIWADQDR